jgi:hypothetical protein
MERILAQNLLVRREDRGRLCRLIILYIIWESHPVRRFGRLHRTAQQGRSPTVIFCPVLATVWGPPPGNFSVDALRVWSLERVQELVQNAIRKGGR